MSDESVDWELKLIDVLKNCKKKYEKKGGWNGLANKIKEDTCYDIPVERFRLKFNKEKSDEISFSSIELKALYEVADDEDKKFLETLFHKKLRLLAIFSLEEKVDIFIASTYSAQNKSNVINRFHLQAYEYLQDSKILQNLDMRLHHVIQRGIDRENIEKRDWYKLLSGIKDKNIAIDDNPKITISNPYVNMATEEALKKIFDTDNPLSPTPPIRLFWPDKEQDRKGFPASVCEISIEELLDKSPQDKRKITFKEENGKEISDIKLSNCRRCFVVGNQVYASDRQEEFKEKKELTTYGLLILRNCPPITKGGISRLTGCIIGAYAPDNLAIVERFFTDKYKTPAILPRMKNQKEVPHVLTIVIENTIGVKDELLALDDYHQYMETEEWREVKKIKLVSAILWYMENGAWTIKSSTGDAINKYIGKFEGENIETEVRLY